MSNDRQSDSSFLKRKMCDTIYRWNNQVYSSACPKVSFQYENHGMIPPSPYYFCVTVIDPLLGSETRMSPITSVIAAESFNFVDVASIIPKDMPNGRLQVFASVEKDYFFRVPIVRGTAIEYNDNQNNLIHQVTINMLNFRGEVRPYDGELSRMSNGRSNVVLEMCGGNGQRLYTEIPASNTHFPDNITFNRCGGYWESDINNI